MSPDEVRRLADDIVARPEFRTPEPNPIERVTDWVGRQVGNLLAAAVGGGSGSIIAIGLLIVVVGLVIWFSIRVGRTVQVDGRVPGMTIEGVHRRSPAEWRADAERLEGEGRWKEALRSRYRALVGDLVAEGLFDDVAGRTTGELRAEVTRQAPDRSAPFSAATELFELAWYADRPTGAEQSRRFQALAAEVAGVSA